MSRPACRPYGNIPDCFRSRSCFRKRKSGAFELEDFCLRSTDALERLYAYIWSLPLPFSMARPRAWRCKLHRLPSSWLTRTGNAASALLKMGLRWLKGVLHKGRSLLTPVPLLPKDPQPCFASNQAEQDFYNEIWLGAHPLPHLLGLICRCFTQMCQ